METLTTQGMALEMAEREADAQGLARLVGATSAWPAASKVS
jgi:hypothetical protein